MRKNITSRKIETNNEFMVDFPENHQFINCMYDYSKRDPETNNKIPDSIILVTKDSNGEKHITEITKPEYYFWVTKSGGNVDPNEYVDCINFEDCKKITCRYDSRWSSMANASPNQKTKDYYNRCKSSKDWKGFKELNLYPEFHASDINIEDFYIARFLDVNDYKKNNYGISVLAFDIEVDGSEYPGFPREDIAPCEVNLITALDMDSLTLHVFAKKYEGNPSFDELRKIENLKKIVKSINKEYAKEFGGKIKLKPSFYNNELNLIAAFFNLVNKIKPDYATAWNARFDILTLYNRLKKILALTDGVFPEDIMCPEEFPRKNVYIKLDKSKEAADYSDRVDLFQINGYTVWIDYLCLYANINKPNGKKESYELDYIGEEETGKHKKDLSAYGYSIKDVHEKNYSLFYEYGCFDTMLLGLIIKKTAFIPLLQSIVTMTRTRPSKALKKTVCERNFGEFFYNQSGKAMSNNHCYIIGDNGTKIKGAFVAPLENIVKCGNINGNPSNKIFEYTIDFDLSSLYPSIDQADNISKDTLKYKITRMDDYDPYREITSEFFEDYLSNDNINYCVKYHGYPDITEMLEIIKEKLDR